jgi:hypothetical protein
MRRFISAFTFTVAACAPMQWVKPDAPAGQIVRDEEECRNLAWREANVRGSLYYPVAPVFTRDSMGRGAMIWPSGTYVDPFGYQIMEENRLTQFCMEAKGYSLERAQPKQ